MSKTKRFLVLAPSLLSVITISARITEAIHLRNKEKNHSLFLLLERHEYVPRVALSEAKSIIHFSRATESSLIVEDSTSTTDGTYSFSELFKKRKSIKTVIEYLASLGSLSGVPSTGIEFRTKAWGYHPKALIDQKIKDTRAILEEIKEYDDGPVANKYYQEVVFRHIDVVAPNCARLFDCCRKKDSIISLLETELPPEIETVVELYRPIACFKKMSKKDQIVDIIMYFNTELLNARLVHTILEHQKRGETSTVACAGGRHVLPICEPLSGSGYRPYGSIPLTVHNPLHLKSVLQKLNPDYDPDVRLPKTKVDFLLDYTQFELEHPNMLLAIPATIVAAILGMVTYVVSSIISGGDGTQN